jgi:hypothetical protein
MMGGKVNDAVAFDKTVRRKPFVGAADAVYGNSIDFCLKSIARSGIQQKRFIDAHRCRESSHLSGSS